MLDPKPLILGVLTLIVLQPIIGQQSVIDNPDIIQARLVKISKALRDITPADKIKPSFPAVRSLKEGYHPKGDWILHEKTNPNALPLGEDPVLQKSYGERSAQRTLNTTFEGQEFTNVNPPDPSVAVGPNHVVQMINASDGSIIEIYDKAGNVLMASSLMDDITGISGAGDPIVIYDHLADRWVLTEFGDRGEGNRLIFIVSTTPDPLGSYFVYDFVTPNFPDYPKYGIWPNMYSVTTNESDAQAVYAVDRAKLLAGDNTATIQRFADLGQFQTINFQAATPVNLSGPDLPAADEPAIIMRIADDGWTGVNEDRLEMWALDVDFDDASNSSLAGPFNLLTEPFDTELCGFTAFACIQQPSGPQLDPLREVLMNRIYYRNFGSYEAIVASHVTDVDGNDRSGVRWYELRRSGGGTWEIFQQGTFAPDDGDSRWMSSIALNEDGSIVLAYNVSSSNTFPSLRYTGRTFCDPLGTMPLAEASIVEGSASNGSNRYGDYNDIGIDESDGTFWFTGEFNPGGNWSTQIANLEIELNCDVFDLSSNPTTGLICPGDNEAVYNITVDFLGSYNSPVTLSAVNLPAGATASFVPSVLNSPGNSTLTVTDNTIANGEFNFTVMGTGGGLQDDIALTLNHIDNLPSQVTLSSPADGTTGFAFDGTITWDIDPLATSYILEVATDMPFTNTIVTETLAATSFDILDVLPPGATYYWRVTAENLCGQGPVSAVSNFTVQDVVMGCSTRSTNDTPQDITDMNTITSSINIPLGGVITDVNVQLVDLDHTFIGDLDITLTSPQGTVVALFARSCGTDENIMAGFDDEGVSPLICPPVDGQSYVPANPLSDFQGENANGLWVLSITDNANQDQGIFNDWTLEVCSIRPVFECSDIVNLNNVIPDDEYNYVDTILSSGLIPQTGNVIFRAPNGILLDPGFEVERTAFFEAYLEECEED